MNRVNQALRGGPSVAPAVPGNGHSQNGNGHPHDGNGRSADGAIQMAGIYDRSHDGNGNGHPAAAATPAPSAANGAATTIRLPAELRSEALDEVLGRPPRAPVRWGNAVILALLLVLAGVAWRVRYPDQVTTSAVLTTAEPPARVRVPSAGRLARLFVREKERVAAGAPLAVMENPAAYEDVERLAAWMRQAEPLLRGGLHAARLPEVPRGLAAGPMQDAYLALLGRVEEYAAFTGDPYRAARLGALARQAAEQRRLAGVLAGREMVMRRQAELARGSLARARTLHAREFLSAEEVGNSETRLLQAEGGIADAQAARIQTAVEENQLRAGIADLQQQSFERERALRAGLADAYETLRGRLRAWEQAYLLRAPIAGRVTFLDVLQDQPLLQPTEDVLAIVPERGEVVGKLMLPQTGAGKVRAGQRVRIALAGYPPQEFGTVEGVVGDISLAARSDAYLIRVRLPRGLTTSYGRPVAFRQEMQGTAEIVTGNSSLLLRVFDWLRYVRDGRVGKPAPAAAAATPVAASH